MSKLDRVNSQRRKVLGQLKSSLNTSVGLLLTKSLARALPLVGGGLSLFGEKSALSQGMYSGTLRSLPELIDPLVRGAPLSKSRIRIQMPLLADNGNLVNLGIKSDLPMTQDDYVEKIYLLSQRNPVVQMALFHLGPWSGDASINTRVRLAGSQFIVALAQTSKGKFYYDQFDVIVTASACVDGS